MATPQLTECGVVHMYSLISILSLVQRAKQEREIEEIKNEKKGRQWPKRVSML